MADLQNLNLRLDTPENIDELTTKEIIDLMSDYIADGVQYGKQGVGSVMLKVAEWLGLNLSNEQFLFVMTSAPRMLCEASPGSGKTTISQLLLVKNKIFYDVKGYDMLALAYNDHAVKDMTYRHEKFVDILNSKKIKGLHIDSGIVCRTFHANALAWVTDYRDYLGIKAKGNDLIISNSERKEGMRKAVEILVKKENVRVKRMDSVVTSLMSLYDYAVEAMIEKDEYKESQFFYEIGITSDQIAYVFDRYDKYKLLKSKYDFSDILRKYHYLLENNEEARTRIQNAYKVVLADEYQDFTKRMRDCLKLMAGKNTQLVCIGDSDQSIYGWRGTDPLNCLKFRETFTDAIVLSLSDNRRCRQEILDYSKKVIDLVDVRFKKNLKAIKEDGYVHHKDYQSKRSQILSIIKDCKDKDISELSEVCIAYRNKESSYLVTAMLLEENIPFRVGSGFNPYSDSLSKGIEDVLNLIYRPTNKYFQKQALWKMLPKIKAVEIHEMVKHSPENTHFSELDWSPYMNINGFSRALNSLEDLVRVRKEPLSIYFDKLWQQFQMYYWNFQREQQNFSEDLESKIIGEYNCEMTYVEFSEKRKELLDRMEKYRRSRMGIFLTTFHGLKGLEFDKAHLIDLDNSIFPNYEQLEYYNYSDEVKGYMKDESVRLFYVAVTRARNELYLHWSKTNPSVYKKLTLNLKDSAQIDIDSLAYETSPMSIMESNSFDSLVRTMNTANQNNSLGEQRFTIDSSEVTTNVEENKLKINWTTNPKDEIGEEFNYELTLNDSLDLDITLDDESEISLDLETEEGPVVTVTKTIPEIKEEPKPTPLPRENKSVDFDKLSRIMGVIKSNKSR